MTPAERADILAQIAAASVAAELATGCPSEISASQCIWESGWLKHQPPGSNNVFGLKNTDRFPGAAYVLTKEWRAGKLVPEMAAFEVYPSLAACFEDHGKLITGGNGGNVYAKAWTQYKFDGDMDKWVQAIAPIYAPGNKQYAGKILATAHSAEVEAAVKKARETLSGPRLSTT